MGPKTAIGDGRQDLKSEGGKISISMATPNSAVSKIDLSLGEW